jgi:membrane protein YqaA with SNARE-associated domain
MSGPHTQPVCGTAETNPYPLEKSNSSGPPERKKEKKEELIFTKQNPQQWCTYLRYQFAQVTKFFTMAPGVCQSSASIFFHVALLVARLLRFLLHFSEAF